MIDTLDEALAFVRKHAVVTLSRTSGLPSLVEAIAGEEVPGSWWGHPRGSVIFSLSQAIEASNEALWVKLIEGKVTLLHCALWAEWYRVVTDADWRARAQVGLSRDGARILTTVEGAGEIGVEQLASARSGDEQRNLAKTCDDVERRLLAQCRSVHTEKGRHARVFRSWDRWASDDVKERAAKVTTEDALARLRKACRDRAGSLVPEY